MTSRLLLLVFIATGTLFANSIDYTLTETETDQGDQGKSTCVISCDTFGFSFPTWSPYGLDLPTPPTPGEPIAQLDDIHWTFTDGNPADTLTEQIDFTGSYAAPDLAPYLGEGSFGIFVTPTDPGAPGTLGTIAITFDQHTVPFTTPYDGPFSGGIVEVTTGPVAMPESSLPVEMLVPLAALALAWKFGNPVLANRRIRGDVSKAGQLEHGDRNC